MYENVKKIDLENLIIGVPKPKNSKILIEIALNILLPLSLNVH